MKKQTVTPSFDLCFQRAFDALCQSTHLFGRRLVLEWANTVETVEDLQRKTAQKFHDGKHCIFCVTDWFGHVTRHNSPSKTILQGILEGG